MVYTLWDISTNNLVAEYGSREEALSLVLQAIDRNGLDDVNSLSLDVEDDRGDVATIASGMKLVDLARTELLGAHRVG